MKVLASAAVVCLALIAWALWLLVLGTPNLGPCVTSVTDLNGQLHTLPTCMPLP